MMIRDADDASMRRREKEWFTRERGEAGERGKKLLSQGFYSLKAGFFPWNVTCSVTSPFKTMVEHPVPRWTGKTPKVCHESPDHLHSPHDKVLPPPPSFPISLSSCWLRCFCTGLCERRRPRRRCLLISVPLFLFGKEFCSLVVSPSKRMMVRLMMRFRIPSLLWISAICWILIHHLFSPSPGSPRILLALCKHFSTPISPIDFTTQTQSSSSPGRGKEEE